MNERARALPLRQRAIPSWRVDTISAAPAPALNLLLSHLRRAPYSPYSRARESIGVYSTVPSAFAAPTSYIYRYASHTSGHPPNPNPKPTCAHPLPCSHPRRAIIDTTSYPIARVDLKGITDEHVRPTDLSEHPPIIIDEARTFQTSGRYRSICLYDRPHCHRTMVTRCAQ